MQIEQQLTRSPFLAAAAVDRHSRSAADYVAVFPTRLALERWMRGGDVPHVMTMTHNVPARAAWYARAQGQFQAWLGDGGFHRAEPDSAAGTP